MTLVHFILNLPTISWILSEENIYCIPIKIPQNLKFILQNSTVAIFSEFYFLDNQAIACVFFHTFISFSVYFRNNMPKITQAVIWFLCDDPSVPFCFYTKSPLATICNI